MEANYLHLLFYFNFNNQKQNNKTGDLKVEKSLRQHIRFEFEDNVNVGHFSYVCPQGTVHLEISNINPNQRFSMTINSFKLTQKQFRQSKEHALKDMFNLIFLSNFKNK